MRDKEAHRIYCREWYRRNREKHNAYQKEWRNVNRGRRKIISKRAELKKYGLTLEQYHELAETQMRKCAICNQHQNGKSLAVDHCHSTGRVRGLLCENCNRGLGMFKDRPDLLITASKYLTE